MIAPRPSPRALDSNSFFFFSYHFKPSFLLWIISKTPPLHSLPAASDRTIPIVLHAELNLNFCIHMPNRADAGHSPPGDKSDFKVDLDDPIARMSDIALRKKKNADAQAAFRQR